MEKYLRKAFFNATFKIEDGVTKLKSGHSKVKAAYKFEQEVKDFSCSYAHVSNLLQLIEWLKNFIESGILMNINKKSHPACLCKYRLIAY